MTVWVWHCSTLLDRREEIGVGYLPFDSATLLRLMAAFWARGWGEKLSLSFSY
jgi:hypothetical protein